MGRVVDDTIVAQASPIGRGGVGIIRVSGSKVPNIVTAIIGKTPKPRFAEYHSFKDQAQATIDMGIVLFFPEPHSFTGENVVEFQGHGGPVVMDLLLQRILSLGARMATPGEFSQRAFLSGKIDLSQAEAIADLIDSASKQAARSAVRSLQGHFSTYIHTLVEALILLRIYVEAAIDFPEEEIDFLGSPKIKYDLLAIIKKIEATRAIAKQGALLREGIQIVIAGKPNAGKSSLLNCLSGNDSAIVTDIAGTTRDLLREKILIDGIPLHITDTAGLRESVDPIEQEGVRRAIVEIKKADRILLVVDSQTDPQATPDNLMPMFQQQLDWKNRLTIIENKIDISGKPATISQQQDYQVISLSAKTGDGIDLLRQHLKDVVGAGELMESCFIARRRHLDLLTQTYDSLKKAYDNFIQHNAGELLAEELRQAQIILGEITGEFTTDDLLGRIFSSFCIGK
jgi:tRNA modification GTPase